jgi:hypothetical protein
VTARISTLIGAGFALAHERFSRVILDLVWKALWISIAIVLFGAATFWLLGKIPGPNLAGSNAILLAMALRGIWTAYSRLALWTFVLVISAVMLLRFLLEAYFRGGTSQFWVFAGSRFARTTILAALTGVLAVFVAWDRTSGMVFIAVVILSGAWFLLTIAETLIRQDALDSFAGDPMMAAGVIGFFLVVEAFAAMLLAGFSGAAILLSARLWELIVAFVFAMCAGVLWSILQSYLYVVRCSTVDIMRRNVAGI